MNRSNQPLTQLLLALVVVLLVAILAALLVHQKTSTPAANIDSLRESLQRTAEASFPAPSVTNGRITVTAKDGDVNSAAETVIRQSETIGATAFKSLDADGSMRVLVQISGTASAHFHELVTGKPAPDPTGTPDEHQIIEVIISK